MKEGVTTSSTALVDITMTATRRPDILRRTLESFTKLMFSPVLDQVRLVVNVDPAGLPISSFDIIDVCREFFPNGNIHCRLAAEPSFGSAFCWTWSQVSAPWVFHLEDDWELLRPVELSAMIALMEEEPDLAVMRLPYKLTGEELSKNWNLFFPWNGRYFECPANYAGGAGFSGHPSLIRSDFVKRTLKFLNPNHNPEKQFHARIPDLQKVVLEYRYGVWAERSAPPIIKDIGRDWMTQQGFSKEGNKAFFTRWAKPAA